MPICTAISTAAGCQLPRVPLREAPSTRTLAPVRRVVQLVQLVQHRRQTPVPVLRSQHCACILPCCTPAAVCFEPASSHQLSCLTVLDHMGQVHRQKLGD